VEAARAELATAFGAGRLHSAYLYGSIPRGTAIPGTSDLDLLVALNHEPAPADRSKGALGGMRLNCLIARLGRGLRA
jgi:predicted nucleotidyltransferase